MDFRQFAITPPRISIPLPLSSSSSSPVSSLHGGGGGRPCEEDKEDREEEVDEVLSSGISWGRERPAGRKDNGGGGGAAPPVDETAAAGLLVVVVSLAAVAPVVASATRMRRRITSFDAEKDILIDVVRLPLRFALVTSSLSGCNDGVLNVCGSLLRMTILRFWL